MMVDPKTGNMVVDNKAARCHSLKIHLIKLLNQQAIKKQIQKDLAYI